MPFKLFFESFRLDNQTQDTFSIRVQLLSQIQRKSLTLPWDWQDMGSCRDCRRIRSQEHSASSSPDSHSNVALFSTRNQAFSNTFFDCIIPQRLSFCQLETQPWSCLTSNGMVESAQTHWKDASMLTHFSYFDPEQGFSDDTKLPLWSSQEDMHSSMSSTSQTQSPASKFFQLSLGKSDHKFVIS